MEVGEGQAVIGKVIVAVDAGEPPVRLEPVTLTVKLVSVVAAIRVRVLVSLDGATLVILGNRLAIVVHRIRAVGIQFVHVTIPDDVRTLIAFPSGLVLQAHQRGKRRGDLLAARGHDGLQIRWRQVVAVVDEGVVVDPHTFGIHVEATVTRHAHELVTGMDNARGIVVLEHVVEDVDLVVGQRDHAHAAGHVRHDRAGFGEVVGVVVNRGIAIHPRRFAVAGQPVQVVDQKAPGVALGEVVHVFASTHVLDLKTEDVVGRARVANDGVVGLADVNPGVRRPHRFGEFNQDVF